MRFDSFAEELMTESILSIDFSEPSVLNLLAVISLRKNLGSPSDIILFWAENKDELCAHHDAKVSNERIPKRINLLKSLCISKYL